MADHLVRGLIGGGEARLVAALTTEVAREAAKRHGAVGGSAVALGRTSTAALLLATLTKDEERFTVQIIGDGPLGGATADATNDGHVRAFVKNSAMLVPGGPGHRVALGPAIGRRGIVSVVRDLGLGELFTGQTPLVTGEIDEDVESYLTVGEQIPSALGCETVLGPHANIHASGGVLVQTLPGSEAADLVREVQHRLRTGVLYDVLADAANGRTIEAADLGRVVLGADGGTLQVLDVRPVSFRCRCSRDRVTDMLALVGEREIDAIIAEQGKANVACNFCGQSYEFTKADLEEIRSALPPVQAKVS